MIKIEGLSFRYENMGGEVLDNIALTVAAGEAVGILGANGAGKSTLVNHLNGVLLPARGSVVVDGMAVSSKTLETIRKKVGLVFQNPDDMLFMPRIIDDVLFGPRNLGMDEHAAYHAAEKVLKELDLWDLRERPPFTLSQGQRRFAAMACVLVMNPSVLVLDEPTSDLDPRHRRKLIALLNGLDITRVIVSHDLDFIWDTCPRVVLLANGRVVADGAAKEILSDKKLLEDNGLELPLRLCR
ncbi:MAG: ABC transporter ATP-binding protein [Fibrobacterota bacterium]